jgi:diguanylate cyclase (GGDEF)-like protein
LLTRAIAAVSNAASLEAAYDELVAALSERLQTRAILVERLAGGFRLLAQAGGGLRLPLSLIESALAAVPTADAAASLVHFRDAGEGTWTNMPLQDGGERTVFLLVAGDQVASGLADWLRALSSMALGAAGARVGERHMRRLCLDAYAASRRMARVTGVDAVCHQLVERVAQHIAAERVTLALYDRTVNALTIAASSADLPVAREDVRIEPGTWVMGHVYASGRAVVVRDIREVSGLRPDRAQYRTNSFAAVPIGSGPARLGVLSATDKRDGSPFDARDAAALRMFAANAALALAAATNGAEVQRLVHASTVDALSGLFNRAFLDARLREELERARRASTPLTLLLADVDNFKSVNDTYGHQRGDDVLRRVGQTFRAGVRVFDVCARYGGDEFAILMPSSDEANAVACAERIRQRIAHDGVTISVGVAAAETEDTPEDLIGRADRCLYRAKADGKNCVRAATERERATVIRLAPPPAAAAGTDSRT